MAFFRVEKVEIAQEINLVLCSKVNFRFSFKISMQMALL